MRLENKTALVTGAGRGIGREIAKKFAEEGARVAINYNKSEKEALETQEQIVTIGGKAFTTKANVSIVSEVKSMVADTLRRFGRIDILVNNAGALITKDFFEATEEDWDLVLDTNLKGTYLCCREIAPIMLNQSERSKIINISSVSGLVGERSALTYVHYAASKAGVIGLTRALAVRLAPNINVNAIAPGAIETGMSTFFTQEKRMRLLEETPLKTLGSPLDISDAALFLASDESNWITGEVLTVSGGRGMR
jgi:3-oxoacyl-[acyl-carrier protein] reductase